MFFKTHKMRTSASSSALKPRACRRRHGPVLRRPHARAEEHGSGRRARGRRVHRLLAAARRLRRGLRLRQVAILGLSSAAASRASPASRRHGAAGGRPTLPLAHPLPVGVGRCLQASGRHASTDGLHREVHALTSLALGRGGWLSSCSRPCSCALPLLATWRLGTAACMPAAL